MTSAISVANAIIKIVNKENRGVSNLTLQKSMYFINAMYLVRYGHPLIDDTADKFEKWAYGPVIHSIYSLFSKYGSSYIDKPVESKTGYELNEDGSIEKVDSGKYETLDKDKYSFIRQHLYQIISKNPFDLVELSHKEPQWNDHKSLIYDDNQTKEYYSYSQNRFWDK